MKIQICSTSILDAALTLLDGHGVGALTMCRLVAELEVEAMTLYNYVPTKNALLDALVERVFVQVVPEPADADIGGRGDWAEFLRAYAAHLRTGLLRHPSRRYPGHTGRGRTRPVGAHRGRIAARPALDAINAVTLFTIGHTTAEVGTAGAAASAHWIAEQDAAPAAVRTRLHPRSCLHANNPRRAGDRCGRGGPGTLSPAATGRGVVALTVPNRPHPAPARAGRRW
ncbi:TetR family transcriptional regulator [Streptomyces sp. NPDC050617]|uniref:TetR family transcriptional regulator n=1 Tax=Streptomyces sp. NPDC050617 TaxID=3154628 RepID=UPI003427FEFA